MYVAVMIECSTAVSALIIRPVRRCPAIKVHRPAVTHWARPVLRGIGAAHFPGEIVDGGVAVQAAYS